MRQKHTSFERGPIRGVCIPEFEPHLDFFSGPFEDWLTGQSMRIYLERPNRVAGLRLPPAIRIPESPSEGSVDSAVVLKEFGWRSPLHRLARSWTGSKAIRSFRTAVVLQEAGAATPRPLIAWDRKGGGAGQKSYLITEEIPGAVTLRQLLKNPPLFEKEKTTLLAELARLVGRIHDAGIWHRDLTIGNFLVSPKPIGGNRIFIIDLSRSVHLSRVPLPIRFMDLARMKLLDLWPEFFAAYCAGRPDWMARQPMLNGMIRLRRERMAFWKRFKNRSG